MIEKKMVQAGVDNLKEFGYPNVNEENIFTDMIYSQFFKSMLNDNKGIRSDIDEVIEKLLGRIKTNEK
jgi:hypothetical protein